MKRALITIALLAVSAVAIAQQEVGPENVENCVFVEGHDKVLCDLVEATTTTSSTTTTTQPTTTTAPTTTTTTQPSTLVIPPTEPYPDSGYVTNGGYTIIASNAETGTVWWEAPYFGSNLPYQPGNGWIPGDREGYRCAYGFIEDSVGEIVGRFAFVRPPDQAYGKVNDGAEIQDEDCTDVARMNAPIEIPHPLVHVAVCPRASKNATRGLSSTSLQAPS